AGLRLKLSFAAIGELIGRNKGVVWREVQRNSSPDGQYRGCIGHRVADILNKRPRPTLGLETPADRLNKLLLAA
ncbi:MAG: hypothetical protein ABR571_05760, partial [Jatrophihabitans sp.]